MDATIRQSFWTDERIEDASADIKFIALWAITNPARDICGFTRVSNKRFTFETEKDPSLIRDLLETLPTSFQAPSKGVLFAVNFLRQNFSKGGEFKPGNKVIIAAVRHAKQLPSPLRDAFFQAYPDLIDYDAEKVKKRSPSDPPPQGVIEKHSKEKHRKASTLVPTAEELISLIPADWSSSRRASASMWARDKQARTIAKHRIRSLSAWQASLDRMARYDDETLSDAITVAIASGWQGWEHESIGKIKPPKAYNHTPGRRPAEEILIS